jgi:proton-dependent oligopeptide transporter, POT family
MQQESLVQHETLFGHPAGLYTLFFAEMWERFSYYGMRALLVFYMIKGFLGLSDDQAYGVYGAYTALVYATPFIGGIFADRILGARRAVVLGGLLMAAGHLMMTVRQETAFYFALGLLIVGNGFFKPNISTIVGKLYPAGSPRRDGGFTIFYMGVNLGAAMSPLICGYVGETFGWHYGFGLATIGMLAGVAVFVAPLRVTQLLILCGALATAASMMWLQNSPYQFVVNAFVALALATAGVISFVALNRGGVPQAAGAPPDMALLARKIGPLRTDVAVYLGVLLSVPVMALLVQRNRVAGIILIVFGGLAFAWLLFEALERTKIERERILVVLVLMFFSMLFWAFFEQAGSSLTNFTDRNIDRVYERRTVTAADVGTEIRMRVLPHTTDSELAALPMLSQEQLGMHNDDPAMDGKIAQAIELLETNKPPEQKLSPEKVAKLIEEVNGSGVLVLTGLQALRDAAALSPKRSDLQTVTWKVAAGNVGMGIGGDEIPASLFQAANPIYILSFGLFFTMLWPYLATRGLDPSTPVKFALGLLQLGLGFGVIWYGAQQADSRGMVGISWLLLGYLLHTTGELCSSPIGLSMVTRLSPKQIVSTVMGSWFLALAFSNYLAAMIAKLTGVAQEGDGPQVIPAPIDTVHIYGDLLGKIAIAAIIASLVCFLLSPLLTRWMHREAEHD